MRMIIILIASFVLAGLPLLIAYFFLIVTLPRKVKAVTEDVKKLASGGDSSRALASSDVTRPKMYAQPDIEGMARKYFAASTLAIPSFLLTGLYVVGFLLCDSYLRLHFDDKPTSWLFPQALIDKSLPLLYAFVGVFLFNLGTMVRRLYLADISEQVFWGAINRLLLSMGLALIIMNSGPTSDLGKGRAELYFSIGFLANIVLDWLLEQALKLLNIVKPKQDELPLQMVRGINIWKAYRLEEEGIDNVQNLATADVLDLTVRTHYSARTLIDWIDQSILLSRLTSDQVKSLTAQAVAISAIELAASAPESNNGDRTFVNALAGKLNVDPILLGATLDRLYEDEYVQALWDLWQSGTENPAAGGKMRIQLSVPGTKVPDPPTTTTDKKPDEGNSGKQRDE